MKASDNQYPSVLFEEQASDPATPAAGFWRAFFKSGGLYAIDDAGAVVGPFGTGGAGATIQYPGLKPGSPTYDFSGAALDGAFSAHSSQGTFATTNVKTQGEDWVGSSVELQYSAQMGGIYVAHANTDLDFSVGGIRYRGLSNASGLQVMFGIAALDSAGTGVGVVVYNDATSYVYEAGITTWNYASQSDGWQYHGMGANTISGGDWWLRVTRTSGTWTCYASQSGRAWDKTFSTRADSITVDKLYFGLLFDTATTYSGRLIADYLHVAA